MSRVATCAKITLKCRDGGLVQNEGVFAHAAQQHVCTVGGEGVDARASGVAAARQCLRAGRGEGVVGAGACVVNRGTGCKRARLAAKDNVGTTC